jgi:hypothetical protein
MFPNRSCSIRPEPTKNAAICLGFETNPDVAKVRAWSINKFYQLIKFTDVAQERALHVIGNALSHDANLSAVRHFEVPEEEGICILKCGQGPRTIHCTDFAHLYACKGSDCFR